MLRTLIQQAASVAGIRAIGTGLSVLVSIAIARLYGSDALGIYGYCVALLAISAVPIANGWSTLLLRTVAKTGAMNGAAKTMNSMGLAGAVMLVAIASAVGSLFIVHTDTDITSALRPIISAVIGLLAVTLLCDQISAMRMASLRGLNKPALAQLPESVIRPGLIIIGVFASSYYFQPSDLAESIGWLFAMLASAAFVSATVGQIILGRFTGSTQSATVTKKERSGWIKSAAALAGSAGLVQLNGYIDMLILGSLVAPSDLGHYRAALQVAALASFGYIALNMLAGQRFARFSSLNDSVSLSATATYLARMALLTAVPLPLLLIGFGEDIFQILFGADFFVSATPALIIATGISFSAGIGMARTLLVMKGKEFLVMRTTFAALAVNIGLCFLLIPSLGIVGAAIANCTAVVAWNMLLWALARRQTGLDTSILGLSTKPQNQ